jgi:hypothetical protein
MEMKPTDIWTARGVLLFYYLCKTRHNAEVQGESFDVEGSDSLLSVYWSYVNIAGRCKQSLSSVLADPGG